MFKHKYTLPLASLPLPQKNTQKTFRCENKKNRSDDLPVAVSYSKELKFIVILQGK